MKTDYKTVNIELKDGIAVLRLNNPPVNQLSPDAANDLFGAISAAFEDNDVKTIILTGTEKNFIAGADINRINALKKRDDVFPVVMEFAKNISKIETGPKPVIAAINGNCLGGGMEIAMGCHYRVALKGINLGQPEVQLGLIPGAGGTQRLPRLIGIQNAIEMITTGAPIKAEIAFSRGLVDELANPETLIKSARAAAGRFISGKVNIKLRMTRNLSYRIPSAAEKKSLFKVVKAQTAEKSKGYIAPLKAVEAMEKGLSFDIEKDIEREVGLFSDCAVSDVAKNLIGIFLNTRSAGRLPRIKGIEPAKIKKVAMLGGGVMGSTIVSLLLKAGFKTVLWDINNKAIEKGMDSIRKAFDYPIKKKKMTQEDLKNLIIKQLTTTTSLGDIKDADLVIEAVLEDMKIKQDIWKKLEDICENETVFATNTSALPITEMAGVLSDPGRMIGLHFFNPADRMKLLEVICGEKTSDSTLAGGVAFARVIDKIPIVVNDGPGFYVNRQLSGIFGATVYLLSDGVDIKSIDDAIVNFGMPMGSSILMDLVGIDINYHVNKTYEKKLGARYKVHPLLEVIYNTGCYGRKTGAGYLDYSVNPPVPNKKVVDAIRQYLKDNGVVPKESSEQEIIDSMLALAVNEAALMIEQNICDRPQDMDLAIIYGTGFPPYRGGVLKYADVWGIKNVYNKLLELEAKFGLRFQPADTIKEMAASGKTFYTS